MSAETDRIHNANIHDIISRFYPATYKEKRSGDFWAISPFVTEKSPSFHVDTNRKIFKCFSTQEGGDAIKFVMLKEGVEFRDAVRMIFDAMGWDIDTPDNYDKRPQTRKWFMKFAHENLMAQRNLRILSELMTRRELSLETIRFGKIGYISADDKIPEEMLPDLLDAGLVGTDDARTRYWWRFRDRIIFPFINTSGGVDGFSGRTTIGHKAKYINSSENDGFNKSKVLYGFSDARRVVGKEKRVFLVEGQMDRLGLREVGLMNVVGGSGTAFTVEQAKMLASLQVPVTIWNDGDRAGIAATIKSAGTLLSVGVIPNVIRDYDSASDPDDIRKEVDDIHGYIRAHTVELSGFFYRAYDQVPASRKPLVMNEFRTLLGKCLDSSMAAAIADEFSGLSGVSTEEIISKVKINDPVQISHTGVTRKDDGWLIMSHLFNNMDDLDLISERLGPAYEFQDPGLQYLWSKIIANEEITQDVHHSLAGPLYVDLVSEHNRTYVDNSSLHLITSLMRSSFEKRKQDELLSNLKNGSMGYDEVIKELSEIGITIA